MLVITPIGLAAPAPVPPAAALTGPAGPYDGNPGGPMMSMPYSGGVGGELCGVGGCWRTAAGSGTAPARRRSA